LALPSVRAPSPRDKGEGSTKKRGKRKERDLAAGEVIRFVLFERGEKEGCRGKKEGRRWKNASNTILSRRALREYIREEGGRGRGNDPS